MSRATELLAAAIELVVEEKWKALQAAPDAAPRVEGYVSTSEAARRAGVGADAVLAWIGKGLLPATKPQGSKSWRIRPADLEAFLGGHTGTEPVASPPADLDLARRVRASRLAGKGTR